jgi:hypothetical protein
MDRRTERKENSGKRRTLPECSGESEINQNQNTSGLSRSKRYWMS